MISMRGGDDGSEFENVVGWLIEWVVGRSGYRAFDQDDRRLL